MPICKQGGGLLSTVQTDYFRQAGKSAIAAGVFLFLSVAAELIRPVQEKNGTVTNRGLFAVYVALSVLGAAALVYTLIRLRKLDTASGQERSRSGRVGIWLSLAGGVLLVLFAFTAGATGIVQGAPLEASFALFGVGLLLLVIGQTTFAFAMRRRRVLGAFWLAPFIGAIGALVAVVVFISPWHDIGLFTFHAAWVATGIRLVARPIEPLSAPIT